MSFVVVNEQFCSPFPVELTVSKKVVSLSGGSFQITDPDGKILFKMDGHALSVRDKCVLLDAEGCPLLCARKKLVSMHEKWEVCRGDKFEDDNKLFFVKKAKVLQFKTHLDVFLAGNSNDDCPDFTVKGNFLEREAQIFKGDTLIAEMKRKFTVGNVLLDKHTFIAAVFPGVDQAFVATLIVIMNAIDD